METWHWINHSSVILVLICGCQIAFRVRAGMSPHGLHCCPNGERGNITEIKCSLKFVNYSLSLTLKDKRCEYGGWHAHGAILISSGLGFGY